MKNGISTIFPFILIIPAMLRLCITDVKERKLELWAVLLLFPAAFFTPVAFRKRLLGMLLPFLFFHFFGFGDVLMFSELGFVFGIEGIGVILIAAALSCGLFCVAGLLTGTIKKQGRVPYAPFTAFGVLALFVYKFFLI